jgi:lipopolysaccharide transport system permease protein
MAETTEILARPESSPASKPKPLTVVKPTSLLSALSPKTFLTFRFLLWQFTRREVVLRFRQTFLGVIWVVLQPVLTAGILTIVYSWLKGQRLTAAQAVVSLWAGVGWSLFQGCVSRGNQSILSNANLVRKAHFPRYLLPVSSNVAVLVDLAVGATLAFVMSLIYGTGLGWHTFLVIPAFIGLFFTALGITLASSGVSAKYRDVQYVIPFLLQLLVFISPIGFGLSSLSPTAQRLLQWNPITGWMALLRSSVSAETVPTSAVVISLVASITIPIFGMFVFLRSDRSMSDSL